MSKEMKVVEMSVLDMSAMLGVWGKQKCDFASARMAVHVVDTVTPLIDDHSDEMRKAAGGDEEALKSVRDQVTLSPR
jgi:hypothetical protein